MPTGRVIRLSISAKGILGDRTMTETLGKSIDGYRVIGRFHALMTPRMESTTVNKREKPLYFLMTVMAVRWFSGWDN
jgi:hypothetical protein